MAKKKPARGKSKAPSRKSAVINVWIGPREYAPGTEARATYK
jgi:hypothetical protein